ncbi:hypothetical protein Srufu_074400 [Streptomyces libani subsp. rufus]|nr:hypothetical protein Srufu_074400 [Streptomyces libani subsp. rufus]
MLARHHPSVGCAPGEARRRGQRCTRTEVGARSQTPVANDKPQPAFDKGMERLIADVRAAGAAKKQAEEEAGA